MSSRSSSSDGVFPTLGSDKCDSNNNRKQRARLGPIYLDRSPGHGIRRNSVKRITKRTQVTASLSGNFFNISSNDLCSISGAAALTMSR